MTQYAATQGEPRMFVKSVHGIRYQVKDVARAIAFYTNHLGFSLERQQLPAFANISLGDTQMFLSGPGPPGHGQCRMVRHRGRAGGIGSS